MQGRADLERQLGCHTRMYGGDVLDPRRCPTATLMASSDSRRPKEGIDVAFSQSPV